MDAASEFKAQGHLPDSDERPNANAFSAVVPTGRKLKPGSTVVDHKDLVCDNKKCGRVGHLRRWCTEPGGGLHSASKDWKNKYFDLMRAYGAKNPNSRTRRALPRSASTVANRRTEAAFTAQIATLKSKVERQQPT